MVKIERISLNKQGLTKFFSPNEARIMKVLWELSHSTSAEITRECKDLSLPCVAGTLDRLVKSGFARREIDQSENRVRYIYYPTGDRREIGVKISERIIESLIDTFGDATIDTLGKINGRRKNE
ncbi:MAG: BlaI/MecI/CopY family transcriptional regulator [Candidatus Thermoplasmatota archaeon]|jgi:predicted transcriptional regulator|nr:BlaI/MecI/CopY family transcriptional regulator [Candidatus Thermoplasmatota archaeon]